MANDISEWLKENGLANYAAKFVENEIAVSDLPFLDEEDLEKLGLPMGPRKRVLNAVANQESANPDTPPEQDRLQPADASDAQRVTTSIEAERRHLTVMFVDMVGYTALSSRVDPEDLRDIVRRFQDTVAGTVSRYGGHIAKYLGDGVLAYFGWPQAHEDQAERSVRAALDVVEMIKSLTLNNDNALQVRVGIASGEVVVGDLVGDSGLDADAVSGITPNLAARLEQLAAPGEVIISDATFALLGRTFSVEDLGERDLKGFSDRVRAWRVNGETPTKSRFEAIRGLRNSKLIGRDSELQMLLDRWGLAKAGEGQVAFVCGEPGIGKSKLIQTLSERIVIDTELCVRYQCSPYHTNSALYPTIQQLEFAAGFSRNDGDETKLNKLDTLLSQDGAARDEMALIAHLLSLRGEERYGALEGPARQIKERLLEALTENLLRLANRRPVLFLIEDAQWIDPTSQELLAVIISRLQRASVFLVVTHRPEWTPNFPHHGHITSLQLNRLGRMQGAELVRATLGNLATDASVERIVSRADGIPLFIEELTNSVAEGGLDRPDENIPETLQASLLARIDRLPEKAKQIAQIGAVVGREFTPDLISVAVGAPLSNLATGMTELAKSEIVYVTGKVDEPKFVFKHVLLQEAAYASLLRSRRQELHSRIADWLASERSQTTPEVLARHLSAAGRHSESVDAWADAGTMAQDRSAMLEAAGAFERAIDEIKHLPSDPTVQRREFDMLMQMSVAVVNSHGPASEQAEQIQRRGSAIAAKLDDKASWFRAQWALWRIHNARAEFDKSIPLATILLKDAESRKDLDSELQAHHALWSSYLFHGDLKATCEHADRALQIYDTDRHREHALLFGGHDACECGLVNSGNALFAMGFVDQATERNNRGLQHALSLEHPQIVGHSYNWAIILPQQLDDLETLTERIEYITPIIEKFGLEIYFTEAKLLTAWLAVRTEHDGQAVLAMRENYERRRAMGTIFVHTYFLSILTDAWLKLGDHEKARQTAQEGINGALETGEGFFLAELHRLHGMALLMGGRNNLAAAEGAFRASIADAAARSAKTFQLRAATDLARMWCDDGRSSEAGDLLRPIFDSFTEGFDTGDLKGAKALLNQI